jgi:hypothetical protein
MRKNLLFILMLLIGLNAFSEIVPIETARKLAKNFFFERKNAIKPIAMEGINISQEFTVNENNSAVYYIFNMSLNQGYIIISAESNTIPVLAYSLEQNYFTENTPAAFNWILKSYKEEILYTREKNLQATKEIKEFWSNYLSTSKSTASVAQVLPLLGSLSWDQGCYYNALTPANNDPAYCNHNPTGCVATAMAMIMKYHAWPLQGVGSHTYEHTLANQFPNNYGTLSANFATATYNWTAMPISVTSSNAEVAKIMYHCGIAVEMAYDLNGSGAVVGAAGNYPWPTAQKAFVNNFKYSTAAYFQKSAFTDANWKTKIKAELDAARPILYAGDDGSAGHAFVLDGYQGTTNDYYHFNFGWGGYANGNFYLSSISPNPGGTGGGSYNFTQNQEGIFSIKKNTTGIEANEMQVIDIYPNPGNGLFSINLTEIKANHLKAEVYNIVGEKVWENTLTNQTHILNLTELSKGIYYVSIISDKSTITKKITIVK